MTNTDKQIIECKYKFQSIEKFAGKPYCILHNETCEFINFVCDKNCQVYEDYKQLKRKEQECKNLREDIKDIANLLDLDTGEEYNFGNIELEIKQLKAKEQECEELKERLKSRCFDPKSNNNRCISYNRIAEDYERDLKELDQLKAKNEELKKQLEITKGLVTVGNRQLAEALLELQKYKDNEQQEKEIQKLYNKFEGSSLIEKSATNEQRP